MTTIGNPPVTSPVLTAIDGKPTTDSLYLAYFFGKDHKKILRDIRNLLAELPVDFTEANFGPSEYTDPTGRTLPTYTLTRDGFTLLAMGFTGKKALAFKLAYINAFNAMEAELLAKTEPAHLNIPALLSSLKKIDNICQDHVLPALRLTRSPLASPLREHLGVANIITSAMIEQEKRNKLTTKSR